MLIAIVSDTHGRPSPLDEALRIIASRGIETIIHCGDIDAASLVASFPAGTHFVYGNCDTDRRSIAAAIEAAKCRLHGAWGHLELAGKSIAFTHGDDSTLMRDLIASGTFDYLFHGHTHIAADRRVGRTRVINPGALHRANPKTFAILDLATDDLTNLPAGKEAAFRS